MKLLQTFFALFIAKTFSLDGHLKCVFLVFVLFTIVLSRSFVMKEAWFPRNFFCFRGACLFKIFWKILMKIECIFSLFNYYFIIIVVLDLNHVKFAFVEGSILPVFYSFLVVLLWNKNRKMKESKLVANMLVLWKLLCISVSILSIDVPLLLCQVFPMIISCREKVSERSDKKLLLYFLSSDMSMSWPHIMILSYLLTHWFEKKLIHWKTFLCYFAMVCKQT